jgi:hypothetical protein
MPLQPKSLPLQPKAHATATKITATATKITANATKSTATAANRNQLGQHSRLGFPLRELLRLGPRMGVEKST